MSADTGRNRTHCGRVLMARANDAKRSHEPRVRFPKSCTDAFLPDPYQIKVNAHGDYELWFASERLAAIDTPMRPNAPRVQMTVVTKKKKVTKDYWITGRHGTPIHVREEETIE